MAELSVAHRAVVAQLIEHCPDGLLSQLAEVTAGAPGDRARAIAEMMRAAQIDRHRRALALGPLLPMFAPRPDGVEAVHFPPQILARLWALAAGREPELLPVLDDEEKAVVVADRIGLAAAAAVRDQPDVVWPPALAPAARAKGLEELAASLDLLHLARRGLPSLVHWIGRPDGDQQAELRLLVRDSAALSPDGAARIVEILLAHLADASLVLRIITQTSGAAGRESFLSGSEMAGFVDRLIAGVNARVERIAAFRPAAGLGGVETLTADVMWCSGVVTELDVTLSLQPDSSWGRSVRDARVRVAGQLVNLLKISEKAVDTALPMTRVQLAGRMTRMAPKLDAPVEVDTMTSADVLMRLVGALRGAASVFGCESDRKKLVDRLIDRLSTYADEALDMVNGGEAPDENKALKLIEQSAEFLTHLDAIDAARTVRRRAAVAGTLPAVDGSPQAA
jgi:hypothetical protein